MTKLIRGRVHLLRRDGKPIDNVDTDMIYHNAHLAITDVAQMGKHALGNLRGFEEFPKKAQAGDIVVAGGNFGAGSSRQQAVDCFRSLGIAAVVADSFGAIYKRNAINTAFAIVEAPGLCANTDLSDGDEIEIDLEKGVVTILKSGATVKAVPWSRVQTEIHAAGGLFEYGRRR